MNKIIERIKFWWYNFISATKSVETQVLTQSGVDSAGEGISIVQDVNEHTHALAKALLRGELTEEVKQLRYRNYKVDRESKKYKYFSPTLALKKKNGKDNKFISYENSDGLDVITIQDNYPITEDILDGINQIENGGRNTNATKYKIEIERDNIARFKIEQFMTRIVVKRLDETHAILDMYFSKYPKDNFFSSNDVSFRSKAFIHELERIRDNGSKSDILNLSRLRFVTSHAYRQDDLIEFVFRNLFFREFVEYDGCYILRFKASIEHDGIDLTEAFYNKTMDEKYQNHEKKEVTINLSGTVPVETYVCSDCGRVVTFDAAKMEEMPISEARAIDDEINDDDSWNVTEYMDMQIVEQTIGKKLCKKCLKRYIDNRGLELK